MEHQASYAVGRYRVVEEIEKAKGGYEWRLAAYDDATARAMPWKPKEVIRFGASRVAPTLDAARTELGVAVQLMRDSIGREPEEE